MPPYRPNSDTDLIVKGEWLRYRVRDVIMDRMRQGISFAEAITKPYKHERMPPRNAIYDWLAKDTAFGKLKEMIVAESQARAAMMGDEVLSIADEVEERTEAIRKAELRIGTRFKLAAILDPDKFAPSSRVNVSGQIDLVSALADASNRVQTFIEGEIVPDGNTRDENQ